MDFTSALTYPFKSIAKVLTIVLVTSIALAFFLSMILSSLDWMGFIQALYNYIEYDLNVIPFNGQPTPMLIPGVIGFFIVLLLQGFWLSGYSIRVIRHIMDGYEKLPDIKIGKDLAKGFYLFIAGIMYALLVIPFFIIVGMMMAMFSVPNGGGGLAGLTFCGAFIVAIPLAFLLGWSYFIGMARCAAEGDNRALFQIGTNMGIARNNVKASLALTGFQFLLALTVGFISQFLSNSLQIVINPFIRNNPGETTFLIAILLTFMLSIILNVIQQFSNMHLIAQYAAQIGLYDPTDGKVDFADGKNDFM